MFKLRTVSSRLPLINPKRNLFEWLNIIFNAVDTQRIKEVGPDRACAEWLIKNGASVKWCGVNQLYTDYTSLAHIDVKQRLCLEEIYASNASIRHNGFPYLTDGLKNLKKIVFHNCQLIDDRAFPYLEHVKNSLEDLQVLSCHNITDKGVLACTNLTNLKTLYLKDLPGIKNKSKVLDELSTALPKCQVTVD